MTRLLQWGRLRRIFWQCEGQWRSIIRGYQDRSQGNNDGRCPFIVQCMFTMQGLDVYYDLTASFYSSRVWRSFSTVMTSKCPTFANSSSTPKAKDLMVLRGFILLVNLVRLCLLLSYANATEDGQGHKKRINLGVWTGRCEVGWHSWRSSEYNSERVSDGILSIFLCMIIHLLGSTPLAITRIGEW